MADKQETTADIIAEMNRVEVCADGKPCLLDYARRFDAAHKREVDVLNEQIADLRQQRDLWSKRAAELVEKCNKQHAKLKQVGNAAKLREFACLVLHMNDDGYWNGSASICALVGKAQVALAAPARNCDVGTAREQLERFGKFCHANINMERCGGNCPAFRTTRYDCELVWAQMPYEEGGAK